MDLFVFAVFATLAVLFSVVVVAHRDPVKSTMSMVVVLFSLAVLFVQLAAPFVAALQVLLYTGAILVLFLFVIMLLNVQREAATAGRGRPAQRWAAMVAAAFFTGFLAMLFWRTYGRAVGPEASAEYLSIRRLAAELFGSYLLPFEMVGLLLLVAVVAASILARRPDPAPERETER